jgi:recombination protein RecT
MAEKKNEVVKKQETPATRFTNKVLQEFGAGVGEAALTDSQRRLAQNYFVAVDLALKTAEEKRARSDKESFSATWENVNLDQLSRDVVAYARMGLDPMQPNHLSPIPYKNSNTKKYDISFRKGYRGYETIAKKFGLDVPDHVVVELVYTTDKFKSVKKDANHQFESYIFEITDDFDRGEIKGGFYYHVYADEPIKNKLVTMTIADILKRKPDKAAAEFWGGEKDVWENGKKVGKQQIGGWFDKMCYKTVYIAAFKDITIDSQKIDDDYLRIKQLEESYSDAAIEAEIVEHANQEVFEVPEEIKQIEAEQGTISSPGF